MEYYLTSIGSMLVIMIILGLSFNLLMGYAGLFSIAHGGFFGIGAYFTGILMRDYGWNILPALAVSFAACALLSLILGLTTGRVADLHLVILTLAAQVGIVELITVLRITGGAGGFAGIPRASLFGLELTPIPLFVFNIIMLGLVTWWLWGMTRSPFGRAMRSSRDDELAARSVGKETKWIKIRAFIVSSGIAGLAGGLLAISLRYIAPADFALDRSIQVLSIAILGGLGSFFGPYIGAIIVVLAPQVFAFMDLPNQVVGPLNVALFSVLVLLFLRFLPKGILGWRPDRSLRKSAAEDSVLDIEHREEITTRLPGEVLRADNVSIAFGGLKAVQNVSLEIPPGEITGLVGPNGAGKTTLFNIMSGLLPADGGRVFYGDREITSVGFGNLAREGIVRSFQDVRLFEGMSSRDNLLVALTVAKEERVLAIGKKTSNEKDRGARVDSLLSYLGLEDRADTLAGELSYADQKLLMIGRLLATDASCYLFDEPMSGLDAEGRRRVLSLMRETAKRGATICLVEHSLDVVNEICSRIAFLAEGKLVRVGPTAEIIGDEELARIYFGSTH